MPKRDLHGPRLSGAEFDRRVSALYASAQGDHTAAESEELYAAEFALRVAHRLGTEFPVERIGALREVDDRLQRQRQWLAVWSLIGRVMPSLLDRVAARAAAAQRRAFASVLSDEELELFLADDTEAAAS